MNTLTRDKAFEAARGYAHRHGRGSLEEAQVMAALAHRKHGADLDDPFVAQLIELGIGPVLGRNIGSTPAATFAAVPADSFFVIAPDLFNEATILNVWSSAQRAWPGFAQPDGFDLPGRGLLSEIEVVFTGTVTNTAGGGTITYTDYWPWGLIDNFKFSVNGSPLENAQGYSFRGRRDVVSRNAPDAASSFPTAAGANTVEIHWIIPVAENLRNLWGAILSQSDDLYLRLDYTTCAQSKVVALTGGATMAITNANFQLVYSAYDVPIVPIANVGDRGVLPDTDVLHRFSEFSTPVIGNGDTPLLLQQTAGEVERIFLFIDNVGSILDPASWNTVRFQFAETEEPQTWPIKSLLGKNSRYFNGKILKMAVLDFTVDNQTRDALYPKGVARPKVIVNLPATVTPNTGARLYAVQESLVGAA